MESSAVLNYIFFVFGLIILMAAIFNWAYFFKQRKAQMLIRNFGEMGARIIYALLGLFFTMFGISKILDLPWFPF
jgi:small neutral amino acid transporter SnatA (MarC family)